MHDCHRIKIETGFMDNLSFSYFGFSATCSSSGSARMEVLLLQSIQVTLAFHVYDVSIIDLAINKII